MLKDTIKPRDYQQHIAETASKQSTLVVLPTGMGKTLVAILVAVKRLEQYPDSKILVMAPTRPLNAQHQKSFEEFLTDGKISLVTGKISPDEREQIYKNSNIIVATPQTIQN
ncbi:DEAD/DEAH box helicase, partial [archaeon]